MGIKGLYDVISKHAPSAMGRVPITFYKGKKIAIDGHNWMYRTMYGARKISAKKTNFAVDKVDNVITRLEWVKLSLGFIIKWLNFGVIPIFVFDGTYKPEKSETQQKRVNENKRKQEAFRKMIGELNEVDVLDRTPEMIAEVQDRFTDFIDLTKDEINNLISIFDCVGLPWLQAKGEAEQLCTMLALEGKVDAVFSKDGDNLALGCPVLLKDYSTNIYENGMSIPTLEYYQLDFILKELDMNMNEFLDLCIFLGCDYNVNVKGIGPVNAIKLMKEHRSILQIQKIKGIDITCLNYENCLINFGRVNSSEIILAGRYDMKEPNIFTVRDILEVNGLSIMTKQLCGAMAECYHCHNLEKEIVKIEPKKIKINRIKQKIIKENES